MGEIRYGLVSRPSWEGGFVMAIIIIYEGFHGAEEVTNRVGRLYPAVTEQAAGSAAPRQT